MKEGRERNNLLYTLIEGDVLSTNDGHWRKITSGELLIFADGTMKWIEVETVNLGLREAVTQHKKGHQVILEETLEPEF